MNIDGKPAYVWFLSPGQINVQAPEDSARGNVSITITNCKATSFPFSFARRSLAPGFLAPPNWTGNGNQYMLATFASDGAYVLDIATGPSGSINSRPAKPGDLIVAYGIGFGDVTPSILPGTIVGPSNTLVNPVTIYFGTAPATITYAGLAGVRWSDIVGRRAIIARSLSQTKAGLGSKGSKWLRFQSGWYSGMLRNTATDRRRHRPLVG